MTPSTKNKTGPIKKLEVLYYRSIYKLFKPIVNFHRLESMVVVGDASRLSLSPSASVHNALFNLLSGTIRIGGYVFFGHNVMVLTGTHDYQQFGCARMIAVPNQGYDITIEDGVWIASNAIIIGPCKIGRNAVVGAGSVVVDDVAPFTVVGGVPARFIKTIDTNNGRTRP
jgi:acetyltransferase-like isoleucine patch superfamily enzyme